VMTRDMHGRTVLHSLADAGEAQLLQRALERVPAMSSQVDSVDENLDAPLHLAVRAGDEGAVKALLGAGANPNLQNRSAAWAPLFCCRAVVWGEMGCAVHSPSMPSAAVEDSTLATSSSGPAVGVAQC
jgi:hypothetical protein